MVTTEQQVTIRAHSLGGGTMRRATAEQQMR